MSNMTKQQIYQLLHTSKKFIDTNSRISIIEDVIRDVSPSAIALRIRECIVKSTPSAPPPHALSLKFGVFEAHTTDVTNIPAHFFFSDINHANDVRSHISRLLNITRSGEYQIASLDDLVKVLATYHSDHIMWKHNDCTTNFQGAFRSLYDVTYNMDDENEDRLTAVVIGNTVIWDIAGQLVHVPKSLTDPLPLMYCPANIGNFQLPQYAEVRDCSSSYVYGMYDNPKHAEQLAHAINLCVLTSNPLKKLT